MTERRASCIERVAALKCAVIIPTYNNGGTIARVVNDVKRYAPDVIVVNDGSTDDTAAILASIPDIRVWGYGRNRGKGYALKYALKRASDEGFDYALTIDADGQHFADDIPAFIDRIEAAPDSLLVGARNLAADNMPAKNSFANKFSNFWYKVETGRTLTDTQSGFRLYPLRRLQGLRMMTGRYEFEVEIIVRAAWRGIEVENIPVKVWYPPAEERVSHFRPLRDFTRISILNTVLVLCALLCYYPWRFLRSLTRENIRRFFDRQVLHSGESNLRMAASMGWGACCGVLPIWGYQLIFAVTTAHLLRLNKVVAGVFSNVSIPPAIPFILYGSMVLGAAVLGIENRFASGEITLENIGVSLWQYLVGSAVLASMVGAAVFAAGWIAMTVCKRGK
ncbi:MAG: DUF2062 domain-containing protein [Alistipes sp.]|nr:DUF2062 domain-containing protein [Alistipes sp.]